MSSSMGRFLSADPDSATALHMIDPQRWNMYSYSLNSPLTYYDPTGRDAVAVNFSNMVAGLGHEGLISISSDGIATYGRFGPVDHSLANDFGFDAPGKADVKPLQTIVQFGADGLPTPATYTALQEEVAAIEGTRASKVRFNYFRTSDGDTALLNQWMAQQHNHPAHYNMLYSDCAVYTAAGLLVSHAINQEQADELSIDPNVMYYQLADRDADNWPGGWSESHIVPGSTQLLAGDGPPDGQQ